ncbi:MAG TPA: hypothetical protein VKY74_06010 [Chloroflexia bacterium]|nr:hypothetical protein [Chloroflexia bacterium]
MSDPVARATEAAHHPAPPSAMPASAAEVAVLGPVTLPTGPQLGRGNGPARVAQVQRLQASCGNRATRRLLACTPAPAPARPAADHPVLQRYTTINPANYTMDAQAFFESQDLAVGGGTAAYTRTMQTPGAGAGQVDATTTRKGAAGFAAHGPAVQQAAPNLKFARVGDDAMAIELTTGEPKVFYATDSVKTDSNTRLAAVGADVRIEEAGGTISVPKRLTQPQGPHHTLKLLKPADTTRNPADQTKFQILDKVGQAAECNTFVKQILGDAQPGRPHAGGQPTPGSHVAVFQGGHEAPVSHEKEPTRAIAHFTKNNAAGTGAQLAQHLVNTPRGDHEKHLPASYRTRANARPRNAALGINTAVLPEVGEGYVTTSNRPMPDDFTSHQFAQHLAALNDLTLPPRTRATNPLRRTWSYHYAGVVAKVGSDTVTLENYNRETSENWAVDDLYIQLAQQVADFRNFARSILQEGQANATRIPAVARDRTNWWQDVATQWEATLPQVRAQYTANQQLIATAIANIKQTQTEGLSVDKSTLAHFKMYGTRTGQSFHEQWRGGTIDPITLRIRESLTAAKAEIQADMEERLAVLLQAGVPMIMTQQIRRLRDRFAQEILAAPTIQDVRVVRQAMGHAIKALANRAAREYGSTAAEILGLPAALIAPQAGALVVRGLVDNWIQAASPRQLQQHNDHLQALRTQIAALERVRGS